tara:strand:- start:1890 stop:2426 length:537 start_codon:yes stop_codon:yes gene_type:complete
MLLLKSFLKYAVDPRPDVLAGQFGRTFRSFAGFRRHAVEFPISMSPIGGALPASRRQVAFRMYAIVQKNRQSCMGRPLVVSHQEINCAINLPVVDRRRALTEVRLDSCDECKWCMFFRPQKAPLREPDRSACRDKIVRPIVCQMVGKPKGKTARHGGKAVDVFEAAYRRGAECPSGFL